MNKSFSLYLLSLMMLLSSQVFPQSIKSPITYVRPEIGGVSHLLTSTRPIVQLPHDYPQVTPLLNPRITDSYLATKIYGFPAGGVALMPTTGAVKTSPEDIASSFDRDFETRTPYYYEGLLEDTNIKTSYTVGQFAILYRFEFPRNVTRHISVRMKDNGHMYVVSSRVVQGEIKSDNVPYYFYLKFSKPITGVSSWKYHSKPSNKRRVNGHHIGFSLKFANSASSTIQTKVGLSFISLNQAKRNLKEAIPSWNFNRRKQQTKSAWAKLFGKIQVAGGTRRQKTIFYSSLYRSVQNMINITEDGKYYSGFDYKVHRSNGRDFYTSDQLWDTFRSEHPLQLLLNPRRQENMIQSYVRMYRQSGWLPSFPRISGEFAAMIGEHTDQLIADTYFKGYRNFSVEKAFQAMKHHALHATMLPWRRKKMTKLGDVYLKKGFFPALKKGEKETNSKVNSFEKRQAVSVTLEASYDDWTIAKMAKALGHTADYKKFMKMAHNYKNLFNKSSDFMAPKSADGKWIKPFNPILPSGPEGRDYYTEGNAWAWTFNVQHDVAGLIKLLGGRKPFLKKLDSLFEVQYGGLSKWRFLGTHPDMTGLIGNYTQGNEPSFHIAYMYDFAGEPWKTQKMIREIMNVYYDDSPQGVVGDDDKGAMGAWYVFSAMGFYPFCPGAPYYVIGSPIFRKTTIQLSNGKSFTVKADNVSARQKYIQSATLNGKALHKAWFTQQQMEEGGTLELHMGPRPNKAWGHAPRLAPPAMSNTQQ